jgi:flagellar basal-body rod modification protein FlgD
VAGLNSQFVQLQALQGASLVGREVIVAGDRLAIGEGIGSGGFDLKAAADSVKVEVLNGAGRVAATIDLGAMSAGRHAFDWPSGSATDADGYRFRVAATSGSANVLGGTLMHDRVEAVSSSGNSLELELRHSGLVSYDAVRAIH